MNALMIDCREVIIGDNRIMGNAIIWDIHPEIFRWGIVSVRWYGLLFAGAFVAGSFLGSWIFKRENKPAESLDRLIIYMLLGTIVGARLGECLFYNPAYYLNNPMEIFKIWKGGLASHGAMIGLFISLYLYSRKTPGQSYIWVLERAFMGIVLGCSFIRIGNFFNSEIIGKPTGSSSGVIFARIDGIPRHPAQLYESLGYFLTFLVLLLMYLKIKPNQNKGLMLGVVCVALPLIRFLVEFFKENQVAFESGWALNMGQLLSVPFFLAGAVIIIKHFVSQKGTPRA